jgi:hypothetical protein
VANFNQRLDYVFARGFRRGDDELRGRITLVGDEPQDRVRGPRYRIWPSDHAGVVARLQTGENEREGDFALAR